MTLLHDFITTPILVINPIYFLDLFPQQSVFLTNSRKLFRRLHNGHMLPNLRLFRSEGILNSSCMDERAFLLASIPSRVLQKLIVVALVPFENISLPIVRGKNIPNGMASVYSAFAVRVQTHQLIEWLLFTKYNLMANINFENIENSPFLSAGNHKNGSKSGEEIALREKLHQVLLENYEIKEKHMRTQRENHRLIQQNTDLQLQVQQMLTQLQIKGQAIKQYTEILEKAELLTGQNQKLKEMNQSLENEAGMLTKIKEKYSVDLRKSKVEIQRLNIQIRGREDADRRISQNVYRANLELQELMSQNKGLHFQKEEISKRLFQYEALLASNQSQLRGSIDNEQILRNEIEKQKTKVDKYKRKSLDYRHERNEMYEQIQKAKAQIGIFNMKSYFPEEDYGSL